MPVSKIQRSFKKKWRQGNDAGQSHDILVLLVGTFWGSFLHWGIWKDLTLPSPCVLPVVVLVQMASEFEYFIIGLASPVELHIVPNSRLWTSLRISRIMYHHCQDQKVPEFNFVPNAPLWAHRVWWHK